MQKLKILISDSEAGFGAMKYIFRGWTNAFRESGHDVRLWNSDLTEWQAFDPDIYVGSTDVQQELPSKRKRENTKIVLQVNPWCKEKIIVNGPLINEKKKARKWALSLKPDVVFGWCLQDDIDKYWYGWKKKTLPIGLPTAADATLYKRASSDLEHEVNLGWVGGYWGYKAINLDKYLVPAFQKHGGIWYGHSGPEGDFYRGGLETEEKVLKLFSSAKVCPAVVEPHTTVHGFDIPERIFKLGAIGALVVSDPIVGLERYFPDGVLMAKDPKEFAELCDKWIAASDEERMAQAKKLQKQVLKYHTYFNRIQSVFAALGFENEAAEVGKVIEQLST